MIISVIIISLIGLTAGGAIFDSIRTQLKLNKIKKENKKLKKDIKKAKQFQEELENFRL